MLLFNWDQTRFTRLWNWRAILIHKLLTSSVIFQKVFTKSLLWFFQRLSYVFIRTFWFLIVVFFIVVVFTVVIKVSDISISTLVDYEIIASIFCFPLLISPFMPQKSSNNDPESTSGFSDCWKMMALSLSSTLSCQKNLSFEVSTRLPLWGNASSGSYSFFLKRWDC